MRFRSTSARWHSWARCSGRSSPRKEYPPDDLEEFREQEAEKRGLLHNAAGDLRAIRDMPRHHAASWRPVQFFTWLGLFCMWLYFPVAVAHNVFGAPTRTRRLYQRAWSGAGICFGMYSVVCFVFSFAAAGAGAAIWAARTRTACACCAERAGLMSVAVIHDKYLLLLSMVGVGIAWASTLSMPYAVLAGSLPPERTGVYMGIFNFFIVLAGNIGSLLRLVS